MFSLAFKRWLMIWGLATCLLGLIPTAWSEGADNKGTQRTFNDDGRDPVLFNVTCDSFSWTTVVTSDTISRSVLFQWEPTSASGVCIATWTIATSSCTSLTNGPFISSATPSFTSYDQNRWNCRATSVNSAASRVRGYRARDRGDYGGINKP